MQNINIGSGKIYILFILISFASLFILTGCPPDKIRDVNFSIKNNNLVFSVPILNDYFNNEYICIINGFYVSKWDGKQFKPVWIFKFDSKNKLTPKISLINNELMYGQVPKSSITKIKPKKLTSGIYMVSGGVSAFYAKDMDSKKGCGALIAGYCQLNIDYNGKMSVIKLSADDLKKLGVFKE